jgi:hypothetical protein
MRSSVRGTVRPAVRACPGVTPSQAATSEAERDHLVRQAARVNQQL